MEKIAEDELKRLIPDATAAVRDVFLMGFRRGVYQGTLKRANFQYENQIRKERKK